jgi:hypothetical protein
MSNNECLKTSNIKAEIFESVDKMKNGGTLHTRIYCFQTDKPILNTENSVNKSVDVMKKRKRWIFSAAVLSVLMVVKKWSLSFINLRVGNVSVNGQT